MWLIFGLLFFASIAFGARQAYKIRALKNDLRFWQVMYDEAWSFVEESNSIIRDGVCPANGKCPRYAEYLKRRC